MISLLLNLLFYSVPLLVCGVVALLRAGGSPSGRGLVLTGGGFLILAAVVTGGWEVWMWSQFSGLHGSFSGRLTLSVPMFPAVTLTYHAVISLLLVPAVVLLLFGVRSARRHKHAAPAGTGQQPDLPYQQAGPGQPIPSGPGHRPGQPVPSGPGHRPGQPRTPAPGRPPAAPPGYGQRPSRHGYGPTGAPGPYGDGSGGSDSGGSGGAGGSHGGGADGGGGGGGF
ncbi:hypothetical protein [Nocardiopsis synnemataformans]|uniref:hypothetical protein n=1 Tax=Nocardiopsis synnemataformans TaxID=61305 RepID=UPI003EB74C50